MQMTVQHLDRKQHLSRVKAIYMPFRASPSYTCQMYAYLIVFFSSPKDKSLIFNLKLQILLSEKTGMSALICDKQVKSEMVLT